MSGSELESASEYQLGLVSLLKLVSASAYQLELELELVSGLVLESELVLVLDSE